MSDFKPCPRCGKSKQWWVECDCPSGVEALFKKATGYTVEEYKAMVAETEGALPHSPRALGIVEGRPIIPAQPAPAELPDEPKCPCSFEHMAHDSCDGRPFDQRLLSHIAARLAVVEGERDAEMLRVKACEHIAAGDEGWEVLRNECPSTAAVAAMRDRLENVSSTRDYAMKKLTLSGQRAEQAESRESALKAELDAANTALGTLKVENVKQGWELEQAKKDAGRYRVLRHGLAPRLVSNALNIPWTDILPTEEIPDKVDSLCDAALDQRREGEKG